MKKYNLFIIITTILTFFLLSFTVYEKYNTKEKTSTNNESNYKKDDNEDKNIVEENNREENNREEIVNNDEYSNINLLTIKTLDQKIENKETFILIYTQKHCSHCIEYKPIFNKILKENSLTAYEIDIEKMNQDERNHVYQIAKISGTPTTIFIENGIEKDSSNRIVGISSKSNIINKLKENHYLE